jgi:hypothetical protein
MISTLYVLGLMILRLALPLGLLMLLGTSLSHHDTAAGRGDYHGRDA